MAKGGDGLKNSFFQLPSGGRIGAIVLAQNLQAASNGRVGEGPENDVVKAEHLDGCFGQDEKDAHILFQLLYNCFVVRR